MHLQELVENASEMVISSTGNEGNDERENDMVINDAPQTTFEPPTGTITTASQGMAEYNMRGILRNILLYSKHYQNLAHTLRFKQHFIGNHTLESDCRSPLLIEDDDFASKISLRPGGGIITPNNARCGKKTMFPMTFGYEEAKSPRSPLAAMKLNTKFVVSICNEV